MSSNFCSQIRLQPKTNFDQAVNNNIMTISAKVLQLVLITNTTIK